MKIVIAPDSFKESLSAEDVCQAIQSGIKKVFPKAQILSLPMADGGEGTTNVIVKTQNGKFKTVSVRGPLGKKVRASYGILPKEKTAIIEMAQASGLMLVPLNQRNPMITTSFGTGELICNAMDLGIKKIILTLGGVATNDAGVGIAQALGFRFLDQYGKEIRPGAQGLTDLRKINMNHVKKELKKIQFVAACDVKNPLCGPFGSARVYGPQKGATPAMVKKIDLTLRHLAKIIKQDLGMDILNVPGAGAAGGAGAGALAFLKAELKSGTKIVMEAIKLEKKIKKADLLITGEGKIDEQTLFGKVPFGVAQIAKKYKVPVIGICGQIAISQEKARKAGLDAIFSIANGPISYEESLKHARALLEEKTVQIMKLLKLKSLNI